MKKKIIDVIKLLGSTDIFVTLLVSVSLLALVVFAIVTATTPITSASTTCTIKTAEDSAVMIWTDPETNVQYIIYREKSGYAGHGGITPRLNEDGTLYISTVESEGN